MVLLQLLQCSLLVLLKAFPTLHLSVLNEVLQLFNPDALEACKLYSHNYRYEAKVRAVPEFGW